MKFEDYYKDFCETLGHPLWMLPVMMIGMFLFIEVLHTNYHRDADKDAHGFCMQKEFVKDLVQYKEDNMY